MDKHTIVFLSDDGTVIAKNMYSTGEVIVPPTDTPQKTHDEMYTYTFDGWDKDFGYAVNDVVYQPVFLKKLREYKITFEDENGNVIIQKTYHYGDSVDVPDYIPSEMPADGKEYEVTWDKDISSVSEDKTYKAIIKELTDAENANNDNSKTTVSAEQSENAEETQGSTERSTSEVDEVDE